MKCPLPQYFAILKLVLLLQKATNCQELLDRSIKLPTKGSFAKVYSALSDKIHQSGLAKSGDKVLVPDTLSAFEKRFLIRYIYAAIGDEVLVATGATLREPAKNEIETPSYFSA